MDLTKKKLFSKVNKRLINWNKLSLKNKENRMKECNRPNTISSKDLMRMRREFLREKKHSQLTCGI